MIQLGPASADDVVLAFLRAEIDSSRLGHVYAGILSNSRLDRRSIIDEANLENANDSRIRNEMLRAVRGYSAGQMLFEGFPNDATWRRVRLDKADFVRLKYANFQPWLELTDNTRLVLHGATKIDCEYNLSPLAMETRANVQAVAADYRRGKRYPELIAAESEDGYLILVEGHTRATAYVLSGLPAPVDILLSSSSQIRRWAFY
jgi:hypothetical protein